MVNYVARFNSNDFCIIGPVNDLMDSTQEVKYSTVTLDFEGEDLSLTPSQFQEIQIIRIDESLTETLIGRFYCVEVTYPSFNSGGNTPLHLALTLVNPYIMFAKRLLKMEINSEPLNTAIVTILADMIEDGFTIEENTLSDNNISKIYLGMTIEEALNILARENKFIWKVDKDKKIYLFGIDVLKTTEPVLFLNETNCPYVDSITPRKTITDYSNSLLLKDIKIISYNKNLLPTGTVLEKGQYYDFDYPISISENVAFRTPDVLGFDYLLFISTSIASYEIIVNKTLKTITTSSNIGISGVDDDTTKKILLVRAEGEPTKISGFIWNGATAETTNFGVSSLSTLIPDRYKVVDPYEVDSNKNKTNTSGIIEKSIDLNGAYLNNEEAIFYAASIFSDNNAQNNEVQITFKDLASNKHYMELIDNLKLTEQVDISFPYAIGRYIITGSRFTFNTVEVYYTITAKLLNLNENFLDIYRPIIKQYTTSDLTNENVVWYNKDENIVINHEIIVNGEVVNKNV